MGSKNPGIGNVALQYLLVDAGCICDACVRREELPKGQSFAEIFHTVVLVNTTTKDIESRYISKRLKL